MRAPTAPHLAAALLMLGASLLFALMGVLVKTAATRYGTGEIVFYRCLVGVLFIVGLVRTRGGSLRSSVPAMHFWRSLTGVSALMLWFFSIGGLPLGTAMTLNYMSSVWMALFVMGGAMFAGSARIDGRLVGAVLTGFAGVALVLQPSMQGQSAWHGLAGLFSGVLAALAYLQVGALGRIGEPGYRVVFYFSVGGMLLGGGLMLIQGAHGHDALGLAQLIGIGLLATVAQMMITRAYAIGQSLANAALQYSGIVFASVFGLLWFDEHPNAAAVLGVALIVGSGLAAAWIQPRPSASEARGSNPSADL